MTTFLLAEIAVDLPGSVELSGSGTMLQDVFLVLGIIVVLTIMLFVMAKLFMGGGRRKSERRNSRSNGSSESIRIKESVATGDGERRRRKYRKRKKNHRPTNPTRAETGGLPPVNQEEQMTDSSR